MVCKSLWIKVCCYLVFNRSEEVCLFWLPLASAIKWVQTYYVENIVPFRYFHRIGGAPPENLPNFYYGAQDEVCGNIIGFDSSLQKWGLKQIFDVDSRRALTLFSLVWASAFGCPLMAVHTFSIYILKFKNFLMKLWGNHLQFSSIWKMFLLFIFKVSWQCFF